MPPFLFPETINNDVYFSTHNCHNTPMFVRGIMQQQGFGFCVVQERSWTGGSNAPENVANWFNIFILICKIYSVDNYINLCIFCSEGGGMLFQFMEINPSMIEQSLYLYLKKGNVH
jgi:hypothetical protein